MGWYVYVTVSYPSSDEHAESALARTVLKDLRAAPEPDNVYFSASAQHFLEHVITKAGIGYGHKGQVFAWGEVGNGPSREGFVDVLMPFWRGLAGQKDPVRRVLVFMEPEQSGHATAYEILPSTGKVFVHDCPFKWDQW